MCVNSKQIRDGQGNLVAQCRGLHPEGGSERTVAKRIEFGNDVTMGKIRAPLPEGRVRNRQIFAPMLPHQITAPVTAPGDVSIQDQPLAGRD